MFGYWKRRREEKVTEKRLLECDISILKRDFQGLEDRLDLLNLLLDFPEHVQMLAGAPYHSRREELRKKGYELRGTHSKGDLEVWVKKDKKKKG